MSNLKRGRPQKATDNIVFDLGRFAENLRRFSGEDVSKWSLKNEWVTFSKLYFSCAYPKDWHIRGSYDFFKRNSRELLLLTKQKSQGNCENDQNVSLANSALRSDTAKYFSSSARTRNGEGAPILLFFKCKKH